MRFPASAAALAALLIAGLPSSTLLAQNQAAASAPAASSPAAPSGMKQPANPDRQARHMAKKLGLSPDQEAKLESILADRAQQIQSARSDTTLAARDKRARLQGIHQDSDSKIEALLNDTQKQQYEQMKQNRKAKKQSTASTNS